MGLSESDLRLTGVSRTWWNGQVRRDGVAHEVTAGTFQTPLRSKKGKAVQVTWRSEIR